MIIMLEDWHRNVIRCYATDIQIATKKQSASIIESADDTIERERERDCLASRSYKGFVPGFGRFYSVIKNTKPHLKSETKNRPAEF